MNKTWPRVRIGEVVRLDLDKVPVDAATTYPMVGVLSFGKGLFDKEPIENGKTSYRLFYRLNPDHFVMSQLFGWEGALALSSESFAGKFVSPQFPTFLCDASRLNRQFLGWFVRRPAFWEDLGARASGMGDRRRTLNPEALFDCEMPLPPFSEQQRIVAFIENVDSRIKEAHKAREDAIEEVGVLLRSILAHDKAATPTRMRELVRLRPTDVIVENNGMYAFAGIYCFGRGMFQSGRKSGMEFAYQRLTQVHTGDFVYPKLMAWEGALTVVPAECDGCVVSPEFPVFEVNEKRVFSEVLDVYFRTPSVWPQLSGASTGTNVRRRRLNPQDFLAYEMPLPSRATQVKLKAAYAEVKKLRSLQAETAAELDALMPSTLSKAFSGEL